MNPCRFKMNLEAVAFITTAPLTPSSPSLAKWQDSVSCVVGMGNQCLHPGQRLQAQRLQDLMHLQYKGNEKKLFRVPDD